VGGEIKRILISVAVGVAPLPIVAGLVTIASWAPDAIMVVAAAIAIGCGAYACFVLGKCVYDEMGEQD
jgi:hypothetical protein